MACGLHEIVRNTTQINSFFSDFRVVSRTISCIISEASLHFLFNSIPGAGVCEVPADVRVQGGDAGQVQQGVREHLARGHSQLFQGENSTQGNPENIWPGDFLNYFKEKILPKVRLKIRLKKG